MRGTVRALGILLCVALLVSGCTDSFRQARRNVERVTTSTEVGLIRYHVEGNVRSFEQFITRLYARNPKYEKDPAARQRKINHIFRNGPPVKPAYDCMLSNQLLTAAFAAEAEDDRIYLLGLGLAKSIKEAYGLEQGSLLWSGMQIKVEPLQRLHHNISQVNWRLRTYRDKNGELLFNTNGQDEDGYLNMGYEVIMTEVLTRIKDDIFLRGGLPGKYLFDMSTLFLTIAI